MTASQSSASEASAGLVSYNNNCTNHLSPEELKLHDAHNARQRKKQRGVIASARSIHNDLLAQGYEQWHEGQGTQWAVASDHQFRCALLTLTYAPHEAWAPEQLANMLRAYRKWAKRMNCLFSYVWVMEPHESGKPHYHVVIWVTGGNTPPFPDAAGWWPHGMSNAVWARSPVGYIAKYAAKKTSGDLPKGARLYGAGGLSAAARAERSWALAPSWLRSITQPGTHLHRAVIEIQHTVRGIEKAVYNANVWVDRLLGNAFIGPWERDTFSFHGVAIRHRGYIEMFGPDGDYFKIKHHNPRECIA